MTKEIIIKGKKYIGEFNANRELSKSVNGLDDKVFITWPRERTCANGVPVIKDDTGAEFRLGFHFFTEEEKQMYKDYKAGLNTGTKTSSKVSAIPIDVAKDIYKFKDKLSKDSVSFLEEVIKSYEESKKAKMEKAKNLLSGFSKEELAALKAILG